MSLKIEDLHTDLARYAFGRDPRDGEALAFMVLVHTHKIVLVTPSLDDRPGVTSVDAVTHRHAAEAVSEAWPNSGDAQRTSYVYWYNRYTSETPHEVVEDIPDLLLRDVLGMRKRLLGHPDVADIVPED